MISRAVLTAMAALWLGGCSTIRAVPPPAPGALEYREAQAEIQQQQAELAVTGARIEESGQGLIAGLEGLETALAVPNFDRGQAITQVREVRAMAEDHQAEAEKLNRQLAEEREATRRQDEIFGEREEAWQRALSERETENAALKEGLAAERLRAEKYKGQGRARLVIIIALALAIASYIIARFFRIFPV